NAMDSPLELELRELLGGITPLPPDFTSDTDLLDALALESAQIMEFVMEVEDRFDIIIDQRQLAEVRNIAQLAAVVGKAVA
ncbi:MAG: acyl carrier protein, partial [Gammaproteobacteria bacterium]|nr:acyl carrier protein [Gammaproteobacteria bacterium]